MKKIFNVMMLVVAMTMFTVNSFAQAPSKSSALHASNSQKNRLSI